MAKVEIKTKEAKMKAAMAGGKSKKKKWNKGKVREKLANLVLFDQKTFDRLMAEVPKRLKMGGSLTRKALRELVNKGLIRAVSYHSKQGIYTRATNLEEGEKLVKTKAEKAAEKADKALAEAKAAAATA